MQPTSQANTQPPRKPGLSTAWFQGIKSEDHETFEKVLRSSNIALGQLYRMLKAKEASVHKKLAETRFERQWAYETAALCGQLKATQEQLELLAPFA